MPHPQSDPLKVYYFVVLADAAMPEMTPFQGFSPGWRNVDWAVWAMSELPADVLESLGSVDEVTSQRMGGARAIAWTPIAVSAFEGLGAKSVGLFAVAFSGERTVAERVEAWRGRTGSTLLHVTSAGLPAIMPHHQANADSVMNHCQAVYALRGGELDSERREIAHRAFAAWAPREREPVALRAMGHNVTLPNHMSLRRASRSLQPAGRLEAASAADYDDAILDGMRAVLDVRERAGLRPINRISLLHPEVLLVEPALFRTAYGGRRPARTPEEVAAGKVLRALQTQTGFMSHGGADLLRAMLDPGIGNTVLTIRMQEVHTFTVGVGLAASQKTSAVMRLSPAVNRLYPALSAFGRSIRSSNAENRRKSPKLFRGIQDGLAKAVGQARMAFLEREVSGPVKVVSDAPVEWLPIGRLPLVMRHQCSRLNATPGNLLMAELARTDVVTVTPESLRDVLVVSAFTAADGLRDVLRDALDKIRHLRQGQVRVTFAKVDTIAAFEAELNRFKGSILLFDGHGVLDGGDGIGKLMIGDEALDVWAMRGHVRTPPIVILSACDTQGLDSPSHATVGNGFLALGAVTVVATLLPIGGKSAAMFAARLMHRLAAFVPAVLRAGFRVMNRAEIVTGMQRMFLASEIWTRSSDDRMDWHRQELASKRTRTSGSTAARTTGSNGLPMR